MVLNLTHTLQRMDKISRDILTIGNHFLKKEIQKLMMNLEILLLVMLVEHIYMIINF